MKSGFLDKLIERLDKLDPKSLQSQILRLIKEKGLLETVFNALQEGVIILDGQGGIRYANAASARLLGFEQEAALRQPISRFLRDIEWKRILNLDAAEWSKLISHEVEITYPEHKFLNFYVMPIELGDGLERGAVVIFRNITQDREKELRLLESEQLNALTLLAAGVAHEIGNPLNSLHIHLQLMERELQGMEKESRKTFSELLGVAKTEVERLNLTISQFLRAIRPTMPVLEPCRLDELVKETLQFMKGEIASRDILVDLKDADNIPSIRVDRNQIKQAFFNLIKNALHAMTDGGLLTISLSASDRHVGISFKDTGVGISPEELGRLFETYRTTKAHGSGLGLMIVQRIVRDHGGELEVHSQPKSGTTFTLFLPIDGRRIRLLKAPVKAEGEGGGRL
ncbi:MAG: PAS domain-containing protein [Lentisphaerae bacterium]|nr:PAS domain-containing protein [Lentisphaerota bacterium]